jgi:hypothetical protein
MTAQAPEKLIYQGETLSLCDEPLRLYLETAAKDVKFLARSSALWRGYVGTWAIEARRLYLVDLVGTIASPDGPEWPPVEKDVDLEHLFPGFGSGVFAHWYTGELRCPMGRLLEYVHGGYASTYEMDLFLEVDKGVVVSERVVHNGEAAADAPEGYRVQAFTSFGR